MLSAISTPLSLRVLLIEDNPGDARLIKELLVDAESDGASSVDLEHVDRLSSGLERIAEGKVDATLLDLSLPDSHGLDTLLKMIDQASKVPILILTGLNDEKIALEAMQRGAQDYLIKGHIDGPTLVRSIRYAIERKTTEETLRQHADTQQTLLHQLMNAQETERHRLAMDIHDGPLQSVGVALLTLDMAARRYKMGDHERGEAGLESLKATLHEMVSEIRSVLANLSTQSLASDGLAMALTSFIDQFQEASDIRADLQVSNVRGLPQDIELLMYRLAQEALANVRKHSLATEVHIRLEVADDILHLTISDNGQGFSPDNLTQQSRSGHGLGLKSMRERVRGAGGDLEISSEPGKGASLKFWCPIAAQA